MKVICSERGAGKTTMLIIASSVTGIPIVTFSRQSCDRIIHQAKDMDLSIPDPMVFTDVRGINSYDVLVDDVDLILGEILHRKIVSATTTGECMDLKSCVVDRYKSTRRID